MLVLFLFCIVNIIYFYLIPCGTSIYLPGIFPAKVIVIKRKPTLEVGLQNKPKISECSGTARDNDEKPDSTSRFCVKDTT